MEEEIRSSLQAMAEPKYRDFSRSLLPGVDRILGVRLPKLRRLAKEILKRDWQSYLAISPQYFEETMLQGMLIGYADVAADDKLALVAAFVPKIDNWSICDSFCGGLKFTEACRERMWLFLRPYFGSTHEYEVRFAAVMALHYYVDRTYLDKVLQSLENACYEGYYAKMAVAWAISACFSKYPQETMRFLADCRLDDFTYGKSLQKIIESYRVEDDAKDAIRRMRRRGTARG